MEELGAVAKLEEELTKLDFEKEAVDRVHLSVR